MDVKNFYASFGFSNERLTLNWMQESEKICLPRATFKDDTDVLIAFIFDYGCTVKLLFDQLMWSILENIGTLVFRTDLTSFGPFFKTAVRVFSRMDLTIHNL